MRTLLHLAKRALTLGFTYRQPTRVSQIQLSSIIKVSLKRLFDSVI